MSEADINRQFEKIVTGVKIDEVFIVTEVAAYDERVDWLVGFTHRGETEHVRDVSEYIELAAQIAEGHGIGPDELNTAIGIREDLEMHEQA